MDLRVLLSRIYCLPPAVVIWGLLIWTCLLRAGQRRMGSLRRWRVGVSAALVLWFALTLWITLLNRSPGSIREVQLLPLRSIVPALAGGEGERLRSCFMNVALFYPAGVLFALCLPENGSRRRRLGLSAAVFFLCSLGIELAQYRWALGSAETDDVINNTLGAVLGYAAATWKAKRT